MTIVATFSYRKEGIDTGVFVTSWFLFLLEILFVMTHGFPFCFCGFPYTIHSKSALINRLLGRRRARTANTPGVTRSLQWIRVRTDDTKKTNKKEYELLDSPGIIPASLEDQSDALLLAACHCIGEASYDNQVCVSSIDSNLG